MTMPDRTVVDSMAQCRECLDWLPVEQVRTYHVVRDGGDEYPDTPLCDDCADVYRHDEDVESIVEEQPAPRAVVAISPDRQWLVVLKPDLNTAGLSEWSVVRWLRLSEYSPGSYVSVKVLPDTGQSADAVLAAFLERKED